MNYYWYLPVRLHAGTSAVCTFHGQVVRRHSGIIQIYSGTGQDSGLSCHDRREGPMSESWKWAASSSRRNFVKAAAGVTAGTVLTRQPLGAQSGGGSATAVARPNLSFPKINPQFMITPEQASEWNI